MHKKLFVLGLLSLGLLGGTFACSGSTVLTDGTTTPDGGTTSDATTPTDGGGTDLVPTGSTKAVVKISGGFTAPGGDGSTCHAADDTYTLDLGTKALTWKVCRLSDTTDTSSPYGYVDGNKALNDADFASVSGKIHALERATQTSCGADAPEQTITFTSPAGDTTLYDDFYFCDAKDPKIYVTNLGDVISALSDLAK